MARVVGLRLVGELVLDRGELVVGQAGDIAGKAGERRVRHGLEADRAGASALVMFSNSLLAAPATSAVGILLLRLGYPAVMISLASLECILAIAFWWVIAERISPMPAQAAIHAESSMD